MSNFSLRETFASMADGSLAKRRSEAMADEVNGQIIDTCDTADNGFETGIARNGSWIIVEEYPNAEAAAKGHARWVTAIKETPTMDLPDIQEDCVSWL